MDWTGIKLVSCSERPVSNCLSHSIVLSYHTLLNKDTVSGDRERNRTDVIVNGWNFQVKWNVHTTLKILWWAVGQQWLMIMWKILDIPDCKRVVKEQEEEQEWQDMQILTPRPPTEDFLNWKVLTLILDQVMQVIKLWKQWTLYKNLCQSYVRTGKIRFTNSYFWKQYPNTENSDSHKLLSKCSICDLFTLDLNTFYEKLVFTYTTHNSVLL